MAVSGDTTTTNEKETLKYVLRVNLDERSLETEEVPQDYRDRFISGKGLGAAYLLDELEAGTDPLSPENVFMMMFGPLTGHAPGNSRYAVVTKSPLTGTYVDSYSGGHFPATFRFAMPGYLGVIFEGQADEPVYLDVEDGEAELKDASELWGLDARETAREFPDRDTKVAAIGTAGENLVRYATVSSDEASHHAGRGGVGAVMGSKNLKAVVATGEDFDDADVQELRIEHTRRLGTSDETEWAREGGTQLIVDQSHEVGVLPTHNWRRGRLDDVNTLNIAAFEPGHIKPDSCYGCPIACGHVTDFSETGIDGAFPDASVAWGPEYETVGMMGANTDVTDVTGVTELADRADRLGMDTISLGNVISFAMELAEKDKIDHEIEFGDARVAAELIEDIAERNGEVADALAEGTERAAEILCPGDEEAAEAAVNVKGMELPAYDPRGSQSMALAYGTSDRGGCHQRAFPIGSDAFGGERDPFGTEGHAAEVIAQQNENAFTYSMVACDFTAYNYERALEWLNALGYDLDNEDVEDIGERAWTMTRLFNVREGLGREEDELPERLKRPIEADGAPSDGNAITEEEFEAMLDDYYERRGYTEDGVPEEALLERLDIEDFADAAEA